MQSKRAHKDAEEELAQVRKLGCRLLNWDEPEYPQRLLEIYDPPPLLYVRGDAAVLDGGHAPPNALRHASGGTPGA